MSVDVHVARNEAERLASIGVVVEAFGMTGPLWLLQAKRLASLARSKAAWWVATEDGEVVGTTLCYPLRFADPDGGIHDGSGIGALATRRTHRRQGIAASLLAAAGEGAGIGLLYSGIPPAYYEKHGFCAIPAFDHHCADPAALAASGPRAAILPIDPRREHDRLGRAWDRGHAGLQMHRDGSGWSRSLLEHPTDVFFAVGEGYARLVQTDKSLEVVELFGTELAPALRALAALAVELGTPLSGWFDPVPELAAFFTDRGRAKTLPMLRRWSELEKPRFWSSDYF